MIVKMQRVAVLCTASSEKETLEALQSIGVLHLDADARAEAPELKESQASLDAAEKALSIVQELQKAECEGAVSAVVTPEAILELSSKISATEGEIAALEKTIDRYLPFGNFNPADFKALQDSGLVLRLFRAPAEAVPEASGAIVKVLSEDIKAKAVCGIAIGDVAFADSVEVIPVPEKSLAEMRDELATLDAKAEGLRQEIAGFASCDETIRKFVADRTTVRDFAAAQCGMGADGGVKWLTGYIPEEKLDKLREEAAVHGWGVAAREPNDDEEPPTLIKPPKLFKPIVALFDMLGIAPGYREADVSVVFYAFFTIFFAMLVGDAGYGALILALTVFMRLKFKKAPSAPFTLLTVFSLATIVWGVLTATYFGIVPEALPACLRFKSAAWLGNQSNIMQLCFFLGAVHLSVARLWNAIELFPSKKFLAQLGWLGIIWTMYCVACLIVVEGFAFPGYITYVAIVSTILIACFMLDKSELKTNGAELGMLPLNIISGLGDIISYVRLFAVGLSSVQVAQIFNQIALDLKLPLLVKIPCVLLILLLGHGINLVMGALSILVHAVRLNTLEFSNHKGISWAGYSYRPFRKQ